jgi:DNA-binding MarR family transcriptional regulator
MAAESPHRLSTPPALPTLDDLVPYLVNRVASRLNQNLAEKLRGRGLTFQHWRVLAALYRADGSTLGQLAETTVIPQSTLSRLVDRMARARLLLRRPARGGDGRFVEVWLSERGREVYAEIVPLALAEHEALLAGFAPEEAARIAVILHRMMRNLGIEPDQEDES